jgi:hypothetical protein
MNERIKQLLNQATTDALYETKDAVDFLDNPVSKQQRELQLEKFAELIVKECCQFNYDFLESYSEASDVNSKIREHFRVVE